MKTAKLMMAFLILATFWNCKSKTKNETKVKELPIKDSTALVEQEFHKDLYGLYAGKFIGTQMEYDENEEAYEAEVQKSISLKINRITKDSVYGQSIVNGNQRPFSGIFDENSKSFVLDEPGDDATDGRFEVKINQDSMTGKWMAYNSKKVKAPTKNVKLIKKQFVYNPNFMLDENMDLIDWANPKNFVQKYTDEKGNVEKYTEERNRIASKAIFKINASTQKLTEKELKNLRKLDLEIIKNIVYARHGYSFKKETFRSFFEDTPWYIPVSNNVEKDLSPMEKENILMLDRFIKYAEDKYDFFGR